jgi:hypothetical protein
MGAADARAPSLTGRSPCPLTAQQPSHTVLRAPGGIRLGRCNLVASFFFPTLNQAPITPLSKAGSLGELITLSLPGPGGCASARPQIKPLLSRSRVPDRHMAHMGCRLVRPSASGTSAVYVEGDPRPICEEGPPALRRHWRARPPAGYSVVAAYIAVCHVLGTLDFFSTRSLFLNCCGEDAGPGTTRHDHDTTFTTEERLGRDSGFNRMRRPSGSALVWLAFGELHEERCPSRPATSRGY